MTKAEGFGHTPEKDSHHFVLVMPRAEGADVQIYECYHEDEQGPQLEAANLRCVLSHDRWLKISDAVAEEFNRRMALNKMKPARWKIGNNPIARLLGKELVLLAWAIEDADPVQAPAAVANWRGLAPEERWWLYTMTAAQTGNAVRDRDRGWRRAVRYAICDNPIGAVLTQPTSAERKERVKQLVKKRPDQETLFFEQSPAHADL